jgi:hypothetical protein
MDNRLLCRVKQPPPLRKINSGYITKTGMKNKFVYIALWVAAFSCSSNTGKKSIDAKQKISPAKTYAGVEPISGSTNQTGGNTIEDSTRTFLKNYFKEDLTNNWIDSNSRKFIYELYDLNGDGQKEIFIGLTGPYFCGSGGCTCLLLNSNYQLINRFTVTDFPIILSNERSNDWLNLIIKSGSTFHLMRFNGKKYPSNPSMQRAITTAPGASLPRVLANSTTYQF